MYSKNHWFCYFFGVVGVKNFIVKNNQLRKWSELITVQFTFIERTNMAYYTALNKNNDQPNKRYLAHFINESNKIF